MVIAKRVRTNIGMIMALALAGVMLMGSQVFAETKMNTANTLKVTPVRTDVTIKPGETKKVQTTVTNLTDAPIVVSPIENDFIAGDEKGTPSLILDAAKFAPTHSLKRFMTPLKDVTIPANDSVTIDVVITVPRDAQAGGYFGAVRFAPAKPDDGGQVNLSPSIASLILLTVPGDTVQKLNLSNFDIQQNGNIATFFNTPNDINVSFRFENKGNVQLAPFGKISVKKSDKVIYDTDFNTEGLRDMVLPDSARSWNVPLKDLGGFGHYTAVATFTYGDKNQTVEAMKSFWIVPKMVVILAIVGVVVLIALIIGTLLYMRGYKQRILNNSGRGKLGRR
ncbi:MAG: DUF916 domain-containing protein [Candidatus Saccharimonadales bacterium]